MKVEQIFEGVSDILFHYTRFDQFFGMVRSGTISLSPSHGYESKFNKGYKYFLSTTRSRVGSFHARNVRGVLITLDGRKLQQTMHGAPFDYWNGTEPGFDEMEERLYSDKDHIDMNRYILKVDILATQREIDDDYYRDQLESLKWEKFPIYVYDNNRDWISGRSERAIYTIKDGRFKVNLQLLLKRKK